MARRGRWTGKDWSEGHYGAIPVGRHGYASESETVSNIRDLTSNMPAGASLSPTGSIGLNRQKEVARVFSHPIKGSGENVDPAKHIPLKEPFAK